MGQVQGGEVAGVKISQVTGNVFVGMDEEAQASATQNSASRIAHLRPKSGHTDSLPAAIAQNFILDKARLL